jgi:hypothetical protein
LADAGAASAASAIAAIHLPMFPSPARLASAMEGYGPMERSARLWPKRYMAGKNAALHLPSPCAALVPVL